jgi:hypothetical protein
LNNATLSVKADFPVNGVAAATELVSQRVDEAEHFERDG